jgi:hypothetical protein
MKRNTLLVVVVAVAGFFLLFNPLKWFQRNSSVVNRPYTTSAQVTPLLEFAQSRWRSPEDYVISSFAQHDIVMLGELYKVKQNVELVIGLIPRLYAAGIRNLGIEFALSDDQAQIDALVTAPAWDESKARVVTFDWIVTWGYQEYLDLFKAAWKVNQGRPKGAAPFRIVGLSVRQNWELLQKDRDASDPKIVAAIYGNGLPEPHFAGVIDTEFTKKGQKALVYCGTQHIFTRYHSKAYEKNARDMKLAEIRRAGNIIYDRMGLKVWSIALHAPWPDPSQKIGLGYPAGGSIDALIDALPVEKKSAGWDIEGTPLGALSIKNSTYADGAATGTLADLFDGYIVQGPLAQYATVTPVKDFIAPSSVDAAMKNFPGVKLAPPQTADQLNQLIADDVGQLAKALQQFR